jgi:iron complex outermembrane recepter protein
MKPLSKSFHLGAMLPPFVDSKNHVGHSARRGAVLVAALASLTLARGQRPPPLGEAAPSEVPVVLSPFTVATDGELGYMSSRTTTGMRSNELIIDVPQTVTIFNAELMRDIGAKVPRDVLGYAANVSSGTVRADRSILIRGQSTSQFFDGFAINSPATQQDMYMFDRVEILKGGNAVLYDNPSGGGLINYVYKRPRAQPRGEIGFEYGSHGEYRIEGDVGGQLWKSRGQSINYRLVGTATEADTQFDNEHRKRMALLASTDFVLSDKTSLVLRANHLTTGDEGMYHRTPIAMTNPARPGEFIYFNWPNIKHVNISGEPWTNMENEVTELAAYFSHRFTQHWATQVAAVYQREEQRSPVIAPATGGPIVPGTGLWRRVWLASPRDRDEISVETNTVGEFSTGPLNHKLVMGLRFSGVEVTETQESSPGTTTVSSPIVPFDFLNPNYGQQRDPRTVAGYLPEVRNFTDHIRTHSVFLQDTLKLFNNRLHVSGGVVKRWALTRRVDRFLRNESSVDDSSARPKFSALFKITDDVSVYIAENSTDRGRPNGTTFAGTIFDRQTDTSREIGLKFSTLNDRLLGNVAVFDSSQSGILVPDLTHVGFQQQTGERKYTGGEIDLSAQVGKFNIYAAIGRMVKYQVVSDPRQAVVGRKAANVSDWSGGLVASYRFEGAAKGLKLSSGVEYRGDRLADPVDRFVMPSYAVWNANASYRWRQWDLSVSVRNITDEFYFAGTTGDRAERIELGTQREFRLGARWSF